VNKEGLLLKLVLLLLPVRSAPISSLLLRVSFSSAASRDFVVLTGLSMREVLLRLVRPLKLSLDDFGALEIEGLLALIGLPIREVLLRSIRLTEVVVDDFCVVDTDGLSALIGLPMRDVLLWLI
jgi:hypothetical protein